MAQEQPAAAAPNPERGRALSETCMGCHGIPNYKNAYPNYSVPKLEGQHPEYIVAALQAYRNRERSHTTMYAQASSLTDQEMADVAAYLAVQPLKPNTANPQPASAAPKAAEQCVACHGQDGVGIVPTYPTLSGQHQDYLERALTEYRNGGRKNPIMAGFAAQLKPEDVRVVAEYYAKRKPALNHVEHPTSILNASRK
jgi:cytochrome c553